MIVIELNMCYYEKSFLISTQKEQRFVVLPFDTDLFRYSVQN